MLLQARVEVQTVDRASATETVKLGSIPGRIEPKIRKIDINNFSA